MKVYPESWKKSQESVAVRLGKLTAGENRQRIRERITPLDREFREYVAAIGKLNSIRSHCRADALLYPERRCKNYKPMDSGQVKYEWDSDVFMGPPSKTSFFDKVPADRLTSFIYTLQRRIKALKCSIHDNKESSGSQQNNRLVQETKRLERVYDKVKNHQLSHVCKNTLIPASREWWTLVGWDRGIVLGAWRPALPPLPVNPLERFLPTPDMGKLPKPRNDSEALERAYVILTVIHDYHLVNSVSIHRDVWPEGLYGYLKYRLQNPTYGGFTEGELDLMIDRVKSDLSCPDPITGDQYIPYMKAIELSNGVLTRKNLDKAIDKSDPINVRFTKPSPQRKCVHIQDVLALIKKLSEGINVSAEAVRMFSVWKEQSQRKRQQQISLD